MKNIFIKLLLGITLLNQLNLNAQEKDYIVKLENDTIYVDKIKLKYDKVKVRENGKNLTYKFDEIKSFYISKKNESYFKVKAPNGHFEGARKEIFMIRLTKEGKVNLFKYSESGGGFSGGIETYKLNFINIHNARPEKIEISNSSILNKSLDNKSYKQLRDYLHESDETQKKLDNLYLYKHKNLFDKVIILVNEYNEWLTMKK